MRLLLSVLLLLTFLFSNAQQVTESWTRKLPNADGRKIEHDSHGDLIVLGVGDKGPNPMVSTLKIWKYDTLGTLIWTRTISDSTGPYTTNPRGLVIDSLDNIYVCAVAHYNGYQVSPIPEGLLVKFNSLGNLLWSRYYGLNVGRSVEYFDMKIFKNKYICLSGFTYAFNPLSAQSYLLVQYDSSGSLNWATPTNTMCNNMSTSLQVDKVGNAYMVGFTSCYPPGYDLTLSKFDLSGNLKWIKLVNDTSTYFLNYAFYSAIDDSANIYITGKCANYNLLGIKQCSVSKLDSSGQLKWFDSFYSARLNANENNPVGIILDSANNVIVFGNVNFLTPWVSEVFLSKYDKSGTKMWTNFLLNDSNLSLGFADCFISENNSINLVGAAWGYLGNSYFIGPNIYKINTNGVFIWNYVLTNGGDIFNIDVFNKSVFASGHRWATTSNGSIDSLMVCRFDFTASTSIIQFQDYENEIDLKFANPFHESLLIKTNLKGANILVINLQGQKVWQGNSGQQVNINTSSWSSGIYLLQVFSNEKLYSRKIVKY